MPLLNLPAASLFYEFEARPALPVLVFSNSLGADLSMWAGQLDSFRRHFSLLRYDSRGQGRSPVPRAPFTLDAMGGDVIALLDALGIETAHFCGISMGGLVGQWLALHAPSRLGRLVLSNTAAKIGTAASWDQRIAALEAQGMQAVLPAVLQGWFTAGFREQSPEETVRMATVLAGNDPDAYRATCAAVRDADFRARLGEISGPVLVVHGTEDRATTPADARYLLEHIPSAQGLALQAAHIANIEAAAAFNRGVLQFFTQEAS